MGIDVTIKKKSHKKHPQQIFPKKNKKNGFFEMNSANHLMFRQSDGDVRGKEKNLKVERHLL